MAVVTMQKTRVIVHQPDVDAFLASIDFFVYFTHPFLQESFGRVIGEAIAAGKKSTKLVSAHEGLSATPREGCSAPWFQPSARNRKRGGMPQVQNPATAPGFLLASSPVIKRQISPTRHSGPRAGIQPRRVRVVEDSSVSQTLACWMPDQVRHDGERCLALYVLDLNPTRDIFAQLHVLLWKSRPSA